MTNILTKPYVFQAEDAERMEDRYGGRCLLASDMGLGKSLTSLMWYMANAPHERLVIICPASLKINWEREVLRHTGRRSEILEGRRGRPLHRISKSCVVILNYDILGGWLEHLRDPRFGLKVVIADECHFLKGRSTLRTKHVRVLCQGVPHVLALSGTPMTNRPSELWPILNILQPTIYPSFWAYANRYCKPVHTPWGIKYDGACRLDELHDRLTKTVMIRRRKAEVLKDLPPKTRAIVPLPLARPQEYEKAENDFGGWLEQTYPDRANTDRRNHRMVQMGYLKRLCGTLKLPAVKEWIDSFSEESGAKLITFGVHQNVLRELHGYYKNSVHVDGSVTKAHRQLAFDKFIKNQSCKNFFGNIQAAGTGWSAKGVDTVMFCELDWVPGNHTQAEDRCHGIGRGSEGGHAMIYYLISKNTIEEDLMTILQDKQRTLDRALDGHVTEEGLNLLDLLEEKMITRRRTRKKEKK